MTTYQPVCDFCAAGPPARGYLVGAFGFAFPRGDPQAGERSDYQAGAWAVCGICRPLVDKRRTEALVNRVVHLMTTRYGLNAMERRVQIRRQTLLLNELFPQVQSEALPLDDPRLVKLMLPNNDPVMGIKYGYARDGSLVVEPIERMGPHPDAP